MLQLERGWRKHGHAAHNGGATVHAGASTEKTQDHNERRGERSFAQPSPHGSLSTLPIAAPPPPVPLHVSKGASGQCPELAFPQPLRWGGPCRHVRCRQQTHRSTQAAVARAIVTARCLCQPTPPAPSAPPAPRATGPRGFHHRRGARWPTTGLSEESLWATSHHHVKLRGGWTGVCVRAGSVQPAR